MVKRIYLLIIASILSAYGEELQIKLIIERNEIVNEYLMPVLNEKIMYGGMRKSYSKNNPEIVTEDLGLNCNGKVLKIPQSDEYFIEIDINDREVEYNFYSRKKNGENDVTLPSVNGGKFKSEFQLRENVIKELGGFIGKRTISKPGQDDVIIETTKKMSIVLITIAQQGDAPVPASPAR